MFSTIITCEAKLEEHLLETKWDPRKHWEEEGSLQEDKTYKLQYPMHLAEPAAAFTELEKELEKLSKCKMTEEEEYQYKVVLSKVLFYTGKFDQCRGITATLLSKPSKTSSSSLSPDYAKQLYIAQMVMQGITLEMQGDMVTAQSIYERAISGFKKQLSSQSVLVVPRSTMSGAREELVNWSEEALYRRAILLLSLNRKADGLRELAHYLRQMDTTTPNTFRAFRRLQANKLYMQILVSGSSVSADTRTKVIDAHQRQMVLLKAIYHFPRADQTHKEVIDEANCAARDWELTRATSWSDLVKLTKILYGAVYLTYNSPCVLRHLIRTMTQLGDYHEASLALGTYLKLVDRQLESVRKTITHHLSKDESVANDFGDNLEPVYMILETVIAGARLNLMHLSDAHECLSLIHFCQTLIDDIEAGDPEHMIIPAIPQSIKAHITLWKGAAHGRLGQKSREPDNRSDHHTAALQLLQLAVEYMPQSFESHYQLALEYAIGARDINAATASAKSAVSLGPKRMEAWHLLALLSTARKDYVMARKICMVGLRQSEWWPIYNANNTNTVAMDVVSDVDSGIAFFDLAMTKMYIESRLRGPEACLAAQPQLFSLFGSVFNSVLATDDELGDVSSAMESIEGPNLSVQQPAVLVNGKSDGLLSSARKISPSQLSGKRSLARSLARSMFSKHARQRSLNLQTGPVPHHPSLKMTPMDGNDDDEKKQAKVSERKEPAAEMGADGGDGSSHNEKKQHTTDSALKRQRSMPHLQQKKGHSSSLSATHSPNIPTEAYFDGYNALAEGSSGSRSHTVAKIQETNSVYYSPIPTRLYQQRRLAQKALCSLWLATAETFVMLNSLDEAANAISEAQTAFPESPEALTMLGQLELRRKQYLPALNEFHAAVSLESSNIRATVGLAQVEYLLGRRDVALGLLKNITRAHGWSDSEAWYWLGRFERELALEQMDPESSNKQGSLMMKRALEFTAYALDLETTHPVRPFNTLRS